MSRQTEGGEYSASRKQVLRSAQDDKSSVDQELLTRNCNVAITDGKQVHASSASLGISAACSDARLSTSTSLSFRMTILLSLLRPNNLPLYCFRTQATVVRKTDAPLPVQTNAGSFDAFGLRLTSLRMTS